MLHHAGAEAGRLWRNIPDLAAVSSTCMNEATGCIFLCITCFNATKTVCFHSISDKKIFRGVSSNICLNYCFMIWNFGSTNLKIVGQWSKVQKAPVQNLCAKEQLLTLLLSVFKLQNITSHVLRLLQSCHITHMATPNNTLTTWL